MSAPDFLLIGQQKAGTRWLYDQLRNADCFWMPPIKEISYFQGNIFKKRELEKVLDKARRGKLNKSSDADMACARHLQRISDKGTITSDDYLHIFSFKGENVSGDITPTYEKAPKDKIIEVRNLIPDAKLIYLVRNPVDRVESAVGRLINNGQTNTDCLSSLDAMEGLLNQEGFVLRASPTSTWRNWSSVFPEKNMGYWLFDDIRDRPDVVRAQIASFLGAGRTTFALPAGFNRKERQKKWRLEPKIRDYVRRRLDTEINEAKIFFGSRAAEWL
jgi:hypothetical protein